MKKYLLSLIAALGVVGLLLPSPVGAANDGSWVVIFSGYTGTPATPASFPSSNAAFPGDVIHIGSENQVDVQISDASGADGSGVVDVVTRDCPVASTACGWYITATCTNPPDRTTNASRCNFLIADAMLMKLVVRTYVSGTFQAGVRTKPVANR